MKDRIVVLDSEDQDGQALTYSFSETELLDTITILDGAHTLTISNNQITIQTDFGYFSDNITFYSFDGPIGGVSTLVQTNTLQLTVELPRYLDDAQIFK